VPGRVFAGAWVSWSWGSLSVGWAPLDYWGRPGWWGGPLYAGYYDPHCWTFVNYDHIGSRHLTRYAVPIDQVRNDHRGTTVVSRAPSVDPKRIARSAEWRDRALREVKGDRAAHMSPIATDRRPERRLQDVQGDLMRRTDRARPSATVEPRVTAPRQRRILEDPRRNDAREARPQTRSDVRDLYERMSRPRETRERPAPDVSRRDTPSVEPRKDHVQPRRSEPRTQPRIDAPRQQAPRPQPRVDAPRQQAPRQQAQPRQAPSAQAPRSQPQRSQPQKDRSSRSQGKGGDGRKSGGKR
jgi:hypothetical protein